MEAKRGTTRRGGWAACVCGLLLCGGAWGATWTGDGDGASWGQAANWGGTLPADGEDVEIASAGDLALALGDVAPRDVGWMKVSGTGTVTFTGAAELRTTGFETAAETVFDCPVVFKEGNNTVRSKAANVTFRKPVAARGEKTLSFYLDYESDQGNVPWKISLLDTFDGPGTTVAWSLGGTGSTEVGSLHFHGRVTAAKLQTAPYSYKSSWCYLHASGNEIGAVAFAYSSLILDAADALPASTVLAWQDWYSENDRPHLSSYDFRGHAQTVNCVHDTSVRERDDYRYLRSTTGNMTLTLKGTRDATARCFVNAGVSLVWDPQGDFTQTFIAKRSQTEGTIDVRRGTLRVAEGATFAELSGLSVAGGATFDLDAGVDAALDNLRALALAAGATLRISAASTRPFAAEKLTADIAEGGVIETDADAALSRVVYAGVNVPPGVYRAASGTGDAAPAPWLRGAGLVTVRNAGADSKKTRTWTGGGDGCTWSQDANWDTGAPFSEDAAVFETDATITSGVSLDGPRPITVAGGCHVTVAGCVSGAADFTKLGPGTLALTGSNAFTGTLFIHAGQVVARGADALGDNAFGAVDVVKKLETTDGNLVLDGVTLRKELIVRNLDDGGNLCRSALRCAANSTNVLLGAFNAPNAYLRMVAEAKSKLTIAGGGAFGTAQFFNRRPGAEIVVAEAPIVKGVYNDDWSGAWLTFACEGNLIKPWNGDRNRGVQDWVRLAVNGALAEGSWFAFGRAGRLDLCGTTQRVARVEGLTDKAGSAALAASGTIESDRTAQLAFASGDTYTNSAVFRGDVTLVQEGGGTLFLTASSPSRGLLAADAGAIVLKEGAAWGGVFAPRGGRIAVPGPLAFLPTSSIRLDARAGGTLELGPGEYAAVRLVDADGNELPPGRYAGAAAPGVAAVEGLSGAGVVTVFAPLRDAATHVWTGAAGDGRFSTAANWEGGARPDFSGGGVFAFPGNGFAATVDTNVVARAFVFSSEEEGTVRLEAAPGGASVTFRDGTLAVTSAAEVAKSVVLDVPVNVSGTLALRVGDPAWTGTKAAALCFSNRVASVGAASIVKVGYGALRICGDANEVNGDVVVSNGYTTVSGADPLGGRGTFRMCVAKGDGQTKLVVDNAEVTRDVWLSHPSDENGPMLQSAAGSTNWFRKALVNPSSHFRITPGNGSVIYCAGGVSSGTFFIPTVGKWSSGYVVVTNAPVTGYRYWSDQLWDSKVVLAAAGNAFSEPDWHVCDVVETRVDGAFAAGQKVTFVCPGGTQGGAPYGRLDLCATRQTLANCRRTVCTNAAGEVVGWIAATVDGAPGSRLTLDGEEETPVLPVFTGAAAFVNAGGGARTLRNACPSTGELSVAGGTLTLAAPGAAYCGVAQPAAVFEGGSWGGEKVTLSGGTLVVGHARAFARHVSFHLGGGKIQVPDGVEIVCDDLYDGAGARLPRRRYRAADLPGVLVGGGALRPIGRFASTMLIFR